MDPRMHWRVGPGRRDRFRCCTRHERSTDHTSRVSKGKRNEVLKAALTVSCIALLGATFSPSAKADAWDRKTVITFSGPVEIPGVHLIGWQVLPAGTYMF